MIENLHERRWEVTGWRAAIIIVVLVAVPVLGIFGAGVYVGSRL